MVKEKSPWNQKVESTSMFITTGDCAVHLGLTNSVAGEENMGRAEYR